MTGRAEPFGGVKQLVVNPHAWAGLVAWLESRGFMVVPLPAEHQDEDDLPTYVMFPKGT